LRPSPLRPGQYPLSNTLALELGDRAEDVHLICAAAQIRCYVPAPKMWSLCPYAHTAAVDL